MTVIFTIEGRLSGTNDIIRMAAYNRFAGGAKRREEKERCMMEIFRQNKKKNARYANAVRLSFAWIEPNGKRDLDNITGGQKVIIDALVMLKIIPNDTRDWVKGISHNFPSPNKTNPRIEVTIEEVV